MLLASTICHKKDYFVFRLVTQSYVDQNIVSLQFPELCCHTLSNCYQCFPLRFTLFGAFLAHYRGSNFLFSCYYRLFPYFRSSPMVSSTTTNSQGLSSYFLQMYPFPVTFLTSWMGPTMTLELLTSSFS